MDAIAFVLGEKTKAMRGATLRELVHDGGGGAEEGGRPKKCHVTLVYVTAGGEETHFSRCVTAAGASEYRLNGVSVSYEHYDSRLRGFGILLRARNFLVFQGDVESVAGKSPKELTALFELVSGSGACAGDYAAAESAKASAEAATSLAFSKRKGAAAQKRQTKEQKEEADRHTRLAAELQELKVRKALFLLCNLDAQRACAVADAAACAQQLQQVAARQAACDSQLLAKKKETAKAAKAALLADKAAAAAVEQAQAMAPAAQKAAHEAERVAARLKAADKLLAAAVAVDRDNAGEMERLREKLAQLDAAAAEEAGAARAAAQRGQQVPLTDALRAEHAAVTHEAALRTAGLRRDLTAAQRLFESERDVAAACEAKLKDIDDQVQRLSATVEENTAREQALRATVAEAQVAAEAASAAATAAADDSRRAGLRIERLDAQLADTEAQLSAERAERRDSERERRVSDAIAALVRCFPGVRGRLSDLITVPNKKYRLAVTVALGRWGDAVVTEDDGVARDCIKHLKDQRLERLAFIPLRNIRAPALDERLRRVGGTAKLALDCCEAAGAGLERALLHALGGTLVCDTHDEAKRVAFDGPERRKVVSLDGTLCAAWGGITGGASGGAGGGTHSEGATRFDRAAYDKLKAQRSALEGERAALPGARERAEREQAATQAAQSAQRTLAALRGDAQATAARAAEAGKSRAALLRERGKLAPELESSREAAQQQQAVVAATQARADEITDRICADLCAKLRVANVRVFEQQTLRADQRGAEQRTRAAKHRAELAETLNLRAAKDTQGAVARAQQGLAAARAEAERLRAAKEATQQQTEGVATAVAAAQAAAQRARGGAAAAEEAVSALQRTAKALTDDLGAAKRHLSAKQALRQEADAQRASLLRECALDSLPLPRAGAGAGAGAGADEPEDMDVDGSGSGGAAPDAALPPLDFSSLPRALRSAAESSLASGSRERERLLAELAADVDDKSSLLEKLAPNLKAVHQYEAVKERERALTEELEAAKAAAKAANDAFSTKRAERCVAARAHIAVRSAHALTRRSDVPRVQLRSLHGRIHARGGGCGPDLQGAHQVGCAPARRQRGADAGEPQRGARAIDARVAAMHA
jgi:structural maintenance of chromosome 1